MTQTSLMMRMRSMIDCIGKGGWTEGGNLWLLVQGGAQVEGVALQKAVQRGELDHTLHKGEITK